MFVVFYGLVFEASIAWAIYGFTKSAQLAVAMFALVGSMTLISACIGSSQKGMLAPPQGGFTSDREYLQWQNKYRDAVYENTLGARISLLL